MMLTTDQLKELKAKELEIFREFIKVCEKLNLKYYVLGGTLLGAVRHKGFIPWDDDVDVGMLRKDYDVFLDKAQSMLPSNLFLQNIVSEPECPYNFSKIRDCNTTFIESSIHHFNINHGVFIDIFPLDNYPDDPARQKKVLEQIKWCTYRISLEFNSPLPNTLRHRVIGLVSRLRYPTLRKAILAREKLYRNAGMGRCVANFGGAWGAKEIVPLEWYGEGTPLEFEGIRITAPLKYDQWLSQVYGDYMQFPPPEKRVAHHYVDAIDMNQPYSKYRSERKK